MLKFLETIRLFGIAKFLGHVCVYGFSAKKYKKWKNSFGVAALQHE